MAKIPRPRKKIKRRAGRVLLSMTGRSMRDGWVTFKLPAWFVVGLVLAALVVCVALFASPELAAKLGVLISQWFALQKQ